MVTFGSLVCWVLPAAIVIFVLELVSHLVGMGKRFLGVGVLSLIVGLNLVGLMPYVFPTTSHLVVGVSIGVPLWLGGVLWRVFGSPVSFFAHLVPGGRPLFLAPLLCCIEVLRVFLRPGTLSLRLMANIVAGHIIVGFMAQSGYLVLPGYLLFEVGVCFVQGYIISLLVRMYLE